MNLPGGFLLRMNDSVGFNYNASKFENNASKSKNKASIFKNNASKPKKNAPRRKGAFFFLWIKYKFFGNPYK